MEGDGIIVGTRRTKRFNSMSLPFPKLTTEFYKSYRKFILRRLRSTKVTELISTIIDVEELDPNEVKQVQVAPHPFGASKSEAAHIHHENRKNWETHYAGFYYPELKRIDIYPPKLPLVATENMKARQIWDNKDLHFYFFCFEPASTLVHEYLHTRYRDERIVRRLSRSYMAGFEKEMTGRIVYSRKKIPYFIWLDFFLELYQDDLF
jgi:hypothetical protein